MEHFSSRLEEEQATFHDLLEERMAASTAQVRILLRCFVSLPPALSARGPIKGFAAVAGLESKL